MPSPDFSRVWREFCSHKPHPYLLLALRTLILVKLAHCSLVK